MAKMKEVVERKYGWKPDLPDQRDRMFATRPKKLPKSVDLRPKCSRVEDQGSLGSCTGQAIASYMEYLHPTKPHYSRLFIYYNERVMEDTVNEDAGAQIRSGIKSLAKVGVCKETLYPHDITKFTKKPSAAAFKAAESAKITSYARVRTLNALKTSLADGFPVVFGMTLYDSFESEAVAKTGTVPMPAPNERSLGGHAVLAVGYDDRTERVIVRNSWGTKWGDKGYFTMPYAYVDNNDLCDDFWTIRQ